MKISILPMLSSLLVVLLISACGEKKADYTVDELYQNNELRKELLSNCKEKLTQIGSYEKLVQKEPNCGVAQAAEERYFREFNSSQNKKRMEYKSIYSNSDDKKE